MGAYHDLYQVERSFRMAKSDLAARPVFHRLRDSIEAHLTIVFAALAVSREAQARTGVSINKIVKTLQPLRTATITIGGQQIQVPRDDKAVACVIPLAATDQEGGRQVEPHDRLGHAAAGILHQHHARQAIILASASVDFACRGTV